jgi:predicted DNA-binding transcriptional regulator YafY
MDTPTRLLRLLGLLSARGGWTGAELAARLEITERTLRRDITRLRDLGYPIEANTGPYGGYELGSGGRLPPLVLDDDEAVAVALALRAVAGSGNGAAGSEPGALSALTKLEQVLPVGLRERVGALAAVTVGLRRGDLPPAPIDTLVTVAVACRRLEIIRFDYVDANEILSSRLAHPYKVVYTDRQWYLVAFDTTRDDWRTFRVDRIAELRPTGSRYTPIENPPDAAALVARGVSLAGYESSATVRLRVPLADAQQMISPLIGVLEAESDTATIVRIGGDPDWIARYLASLSCGFEIIEPEAVRDELHRLARTLLDT